jgi:hypothetical protein
MPPYFNQLEYVQNEKTTLFDSTGTGKKSRLQLEERLSDFGWHLTSPSPDLGEDFIVEIYHEGQNTGVTFYIQEKSVTNIEELKNKDNRLVYRLKVKDLIHWEGFSLPVVIVIWDINLRIGKWELVKDLIKHLDRSNIQWRNKSVVQVYIPWENETTDGGLKRLRVEIGRQVYPLISLGKDLSMSMKLAFPNTPEGLKLRKTFDLHIKEGEPVTLKGDVIQELKFSDWWEAWFGGFDLKEVEVFIGENKPDLPVPISFKIIPRTGKTVGLSRMDFRLIRSGTELIKFSNKHTNCPLLLNFNLRKEGNLLQGTLNYVFRHMGGAPLELLEYLDFTKAIAIGGILQLEFHDVNQSYITKFPPVPNTGPDTAFYNLVKKLCTVQDKIGHFFRIPNEGILSKDANSIWELFEIVEHSIVHYKDTTMSINIKDKALKMLLDLHKEGKPIHLKSIASDSFVELFGENFSVGPMVRETTGYVEMSVSEFEEAIKSLRPGEFLEVNLIKVNGTETFSKWNPSSA